MTSKISGGDYGAIFRSRERKIVLIAAVVTLTILALLAPGVASAAFTRPFLREITGTPSGPFGTKLREIEGGGGVAVEPAEVPGEKEDSVWIGTGAELDEFSPAYETAEVPNHFLKSEAGGAVSLAIERASGKKYREGRKHYVAVDDSPPGSLVDHSACGAMPLAPGECFVYVTNEGEGVEKLSSSGKAEPFAFDKECEETKCEYVEANKITGIPGDPKGVFGTGAGLDGVAVDAVGDIFLANAERSAVYEYEASGKFVREFSLKSDEVPPVRPEVLSKGFIRGIAIDPVSGHLLVSVEHEEAGNVYLGAVYEFEAATGRFVNQIVATSGGGELQKPVAMAVDSKGDLYVVDEAQGVVVVYGAGAYKPSVTLGEATKRTATTALLNGSVNPEQQGNGTPAPLTECYFQYVGEKAYNEVNPVTKAKEGFAKAEKALCEAPDAAEIQEKYEKSEGTYGVHANIASLKSGETYHYRLLATTEKAKLGGEQVSGALAFTASHTPEVVSATADNVSSEFAELHAQIDPLGADTSYFFEYGPTTAYGHNIPALPDGEAAPVSIGSGGAVGDSVESVVQDVGGLTPGTTYHFRVVAVNSVGTEYGADESFVTLPEVTATDRGYELVTPAQKEGGGDMFAEAETNGKFLNKLDDGTPSASGEAFLLETNSPFGAFPFAVEGAYVFRREPAKGGWSYKSLAAEKLGVQSFESVVFDPFDFSRVAVNDGLGAKVGAEGESLTNLLGSPGASRPLCAPGTSLEGALDGDCYIELHEDSVPFHLDADEASDTKVVGAAETLEHVVLESRSELVAEGKEAQACPGAGAVTHGEVLCEWAGGQLRLVNVKPGSEGAVPVSACGAGIGDSWGSRASSEAYGGKAGSAYRAVSADGSRVFFTAPDPNTPRKEGAEGCWNGAAEEAENGPVNAPQLYVRVGGAATLKVSEPEKTVKEGPGKPHAYPVYYAGASEDGSRVFFLTKTWVTQDHPAGHDLELYECQITESEGELGCTLTRVSAGEESQPGYKAGASIQRVPAVAADGDAVYFEATGKLTADAPVTGGLYYYNTQQTPRATFPWVGSGNQVEPRAVSARRSSARSVTGTRPRTGNTCCTSALRASSNATTLRMEASRRSRAAARNSRARRWEKVTSRAAR